MNEYDKAMKKLDEKLGHKDGLISLDQQNSLVTWVDTEEMAHKTLRIVLFNK